MKPISDKAEIIDALLDSYRRGYFPMAEPSPPWNPFGGSHIYWPSPDPRGVLPLRESEGLHVPRRLERVIRQRRFSIRCDTAFERVMRGCALPRTSVIAGDEEGTWIDETLIRWFTILHEAGHAHSMEAWRTDPRTGEDRLVGGVYGVAIGSAFFGESMFHLSRRRLPDGTRHPLDGSDSSKVCLVHLVRHLESLGFELFDTQMVTSHVAGFGGRDLPRREYLMRLTPCVEGAPRWRALEPIDQA